MDARFTESYEMFQQWKSQNDEIIGYCNWAAELEHSLLESWTHKSYGAIIAQIWPNGKGYVIFYAVKEGANAEWGIFVALKNLVQELYDATENEFTGPSPKKLKYLSPAKKLVQHIEKQDG